MTTIVSEFTSRSAEQRRLALARANEIRSARAAIKRDVKCGLVDSRSLVARPPDVMKAMSVVDLLMAVPSVGRVKVNRMLRDAVVSPRKTLGGLSERQRRELIALMPAGRK